MKLFRTKMVQLEESKNSLFLYDFSKAFCLVELLHWGGISLVIYMLNYLMYFNMEMLDKKKKIILYCQTLQFTILFWYGLVTFNYRLTLKLFRNHATRKYETWLYDLYLFLVYTLFTNFDLYMSTFGFIFEIWHCKGKSMSFYFLHFHFSK